jgi:hypothetical protein
VSRPAADARAGVAGEDALLLLFSLQEDDAAGGGEVKGSAHQSDWRLHVVTCSLASW